MVDLPPDGFFSPLTSRPFGPLTIPPDKPGVVAAAIAAGLPVVLVHGVPWARPFVQDFIDAWVPPDAQDEPATPRSLLPALLAVRPLLRARWGTVTLVAPGGAVAHGLGAVPSLVVLQPRGGSVLWHARETGRDAAAVGVALLTAGGAAVAAGQARTLDWIAIP